MLKRDVQIGQDQPIGHQRDQVANMRIGIDIVQPHPRTQGPKIPREVGDVGAVASVLGVFDINAIGRSILTDHQQFFDASIDQLFCFAQDRVGRTAGKSAAHIRNDAEFTFVVTALGNFQIAVMARCQADAGCGQQVDERVWIRRHALMHGVEHLFILMRTGNGQNRRMGAANVIFFSTETSGHNHLAIFLKRLANRIQTFGFGTVEKSAGIHDHRVGVSIVRRNRITLSPQAGQDTFAINQRFRATKADHADFRLTGTSGCIDFRFGREVGA